MTRLYLLVRPVFRESGDKVLGVYYDHGLAECAWSYYREGFKKLHGYAPAGLRIDRVFLNKWPEIE